MNSSKSTHTIRHWLLAALLAIALLTAYTTFSTSQSSVVQPGGPALVGPGNAPGNG